MTNPYITIPELSPKDIERFWNLVDSSDPEGCWKWKGATAKRGYGVYRLQGRNYVTSRIAYLLGHDQDPGKLLVLHSCDNPACCRPAHLSLGTHKENTADMIAKGRQAKGEQVANRGERNGMRTKPESILRGSDSFPARHPEKMSRGERQHLSKLTEPDILEIRRRYAAGETNKEKLGRDFGISGSHINNIVAYRAWRHIP